MATGASSNYFGHDAWELFAPGLKSLQEAMVIRRNILCAFEVAENEPDPEKRQALLTFVLVGGDRPLVWGGGCSLLSDEQGGGTTHWALSSDVELLMKLSQTQVERCPIYVMHGRGNT